MLIDLRAMNRFMTAGRPAGSLLQEAGMVDVSNKNCAGLRLLFEMAL